MAGPPIDRQDFEIAIICALPLEYDAVSILFDKFWDESGDQYGRAVGDANTYTTGRIGVFDVVLVLLSSMGKVNAASTAASLRSSYPNLSLVLLTGICGGVPSPPTGEDILLGDVIISQTVIQYDFGRQYPDGFRMKEATDSMASHPSKNVLNFIKTMETGLGFRRLTKRAAELLEEIQDVSHKSTKYQYPGSQNDKLYQASYRHKHYISFQCICHQCRNSRDPVCEDSLGQDCRELGCSESFLVQRQRLDAKLDLEMKGNIKGAQAPSIFMGRIGSGDTVLKSAEDRDRISKRYSLMAFEMEGAGLWNDLPCIVVKGVCDYADSHKNKKWQNFAAATASAVTRGLVERYVKTDRSRQTHLDRNIRGLENREMNQCLRDLRKTDPRHDKANIERMKGGLLQDSYRWVLKAPEFQQWRDNPQSQLLWIKGDPGKGKTMLLCGIIDELESSYSRPLAYFFCRATEHDLNKATYILRGLIWFLIARRPSLITYVQKPYDAAGEKLFEDHNAWQALSQILLAMLSDDTLRDAIIIIDALDECQQDLPLLLDFLSEASLTRPVKWIVSSRNWLLIEDKLIKHSERLKLSLELNANSIAAAVQIFIQQKVQELAHTKGYDVNMRAEVENYLISNASDTFLWVSLVCQELADPRIRNRHTMTKLKTFPPGLDALYHRMMEQLSSSEDAYLCKQILATMSITYQPLSIQELGCSLSLTATLTDDEIEEAVNSCGSFLTVQEKIVHFIHQSAKDYLLEKVRERIFPAGVAQQHYAIFEKSLEALSRTLRRDIYNLREPGFPIDGISPPESDPLLPVRYACIYWAQHLIDSKMSLQGDGYGDRIASLQTLVNKFLEKAYVYWIEALALFRRLSDGIKALEDLNILVADLGAHELAELSQDAYRFLLDNKYGIEIAPLQTYASAIIFTPTKMKLGNIIKSEAPDWVAATQPISGHWDSYLSAISDPHGGFTAIKFSPSSDLLAAASSDHTIRLWQVQTKHWCDHVFEGHRSTITFLAFSNNSSFLASCSSDCEVLLWHIHNSTCIHELFTAVDFIPHHVVFSPDTKLIAADSIRSRQSDSAHKLQVWSLENGQCISTIDIDFYGGENAIFFSMDSTTLIISRWGQLQTWDIRTGICVRKLKFKQDSLGDAISYNLKLVASNLGGHLCLWCIETGRLLRKLPGKKEGNWDVMFSRDSNLVARKSCQEIQIWRVNTGELLQEIETNDHRDGLGTFTFSYDSALIAVVTNMTSLIKIWPTARKKVIIERQGHDVGQRNRHVSFSKDLAMIAVASEDNEINLWCANTGRHLRELAGPRRMSPAFLSMRFSPDSRLIAATFFSIPVQLMYRFGRWALCYSTLMIWCANSGKLFYKTRIRGQQAFVSLFSPNSEFLAVDSDKKYHIWRIQLFNNLCRVSSLGNDVLIGSQMSFSPDSKLFAHSSSRWSIRILNMPSMTEKIDFMSMTHRARIAFSSDGSILVSASHLKIQLWNIESGHCIKALKGDGFDTVLAISHNSRFLALGIETVWEKERKIQLWHIDKGECVGQIQAYAIDDLSFTSDGLQLLTSMGAIAIKYPGTSGRQVAEFYQVGYGVSQDECWIMRNGDNILWIPPEFRTRETMVVGNSVFIRATSGRWNILIFSPEEEFYEQENTRNRLVEQTTGR